MCVVIDYMIQIMLSLTFILFIEYVINLEVHNLAYFYSNRVRFERLGTEGIEIDSQSQSLVQTKVANQSSPAFCYECCHFPIKIRWRIGLIGIWSLAGSVSRFWGTNQRRPTQNMYNPIDFLRTTEAHIFLIDELFHVNLLPKCYLSVIYFIRHDPTWIMGG